MIKVSLWTIISSDKIEYEARIDSPESFRAVGDSPSLAFRRLRERAKICWSGQRMEYLDIVIKDFKKGFDYRCAIKEYERNKNANK